MIEESDDGWCIVDVSGIDVSNRPTGRLLKAKSHAKEVFGDGCHRRRGKSQSFVRSSKAELPSSATCARVCGPSLERAAGKIPAMMKIVHTGWCAVFQRIQCSASSPPFVPSQKVSCPPEKSKPPRKRRLI